MGILTCSPRGWMLAGAEPYALPSSQVSVSQRDASRFSGAWLGWLPWALVDRCMGRPKDEGTSCRHCQHARWMVGRCSCPCPRAVWGCAVTTATVCCGGAGASSSSSSFLCLCFKPWKPPGSGLTLATRSQVPLVALQLSMSLLARQCCGRSVTSALAQGLVQFPCGCPHTPIPEPWQDTSPGKEGWICLFLLPGTWLCPPTGPAACPLLPRSSLSPEACLPKRGCGHWWGTVG